ncbi:MAG TPA: hypothetical protein VF590_16770 [Isosphaeraceae bacterium]
MPPANDSQGLKIAVAAFVSLTVVLAVTSYFLYSSYAKASAQLTEANTKASQSQKAAADALREFEDLRTRAGYAKLAESQAWRDEVKKDQEKANARLADASKAVAGMVAAAQQQGANDPRLADLAQRTDQIARDFMDEKTTTFASSIDRLAELVGNLAQLTAAFALDNINIRGQLNSVNRVNQTTLSAQEEVVNRTTADLETVQRKHEEDRQGLIARLDQLQGQNTQLASENDTLKAQLSQTGEEAKKNLVDMTAQMQYWRTQAQKSETVMDQPDGVVTYVDYTRRELRTNLSRGTGARPQLQMAVFDRNAQGIPTDRPKGTIQLIEVGPNDSVARILTTTNSIEPIRAGDKIYSAAWSPGEPKRFALIGKIDIDRDGRDDRNDLVRLIEAAGGSVDYNLPPPGAGPEKGELTGRISWYVIDEREAFRSTGRNAVAPADVSEEENRFDVKRTAALQKAAVLGIAPITIQRLLPSLGYSAGMAIPGRVQALDRNASDALISPRSKNAAPAAAGAPR